MQKELRVKVDDVQLLCDAERELLAQRGSPPTHPGPNTPAAQLYYSMAEVELFLML